MDDMPCIEHIGKFENVPQPGHIGQLYLILVLKIDRRGTVNHTLDAGEQLTIDVAAAALRFGNVTADDFDLPPISGDRANAHASFARVLCADQTDDFIALSKEPPKEHRSKSACRAREQDCVLHTRPHSAVIQQGAASRKVSVGNVYGSALKRRLSYQPALMIMHWPSPGGRWT